MSNLAELAHPSICHSDLMLATPGKLFSAKGWVFELKYDGFRCLVTKCSDGVRLESRNGRDMSDVFPELVDEIRPIKHDFVADGELVILDNMGCPQWDRLKRRHVLRHTQRIRQAAAENPAVVFAFDLLWLNGADFRQRTLLERKDALHRTLAASRRIRYTRHLSDSCADVWKLAVQMDLEGIVAKDGSSPIYRRALHALAEDQDRYRQAARAGKKAVRMCGRYALYGPRSRSRAEAQYFANHDFPGSLAVGRATRHRVGRLIQRRLWPGLPRPSHG